MTKFPFKDEFLPALSYKQLAFRWGVSRMTIRRVVDRGELPAMKLAGKMVVLGEDWKSYEEQCKANHTPSSSQERTPAFCASDTTTKAEEENSFRRGLRMRNALSES